MTVKRPRTVRRTRRGRPLKNDATPDMRERILDAAEDHFSRHGFWGVTIREVAQDAKVDTALLHYYFDTKRGLFDAVSRSTPARLVQRRSALRRSYVRGSVRRS